MKTETFKQKNKTFECNGNEIADQLLYTLENSYILSDEFKVRIRNIISVILSNADDNKEYILDSIEILYTDLSYTNIFTYEFKEYLVQYLKICYNKQLFLNKNK